MMMTLVRTVFDSYHLLTRLVLSRQKPSFHFQPMVCIISEICNNKKVICWSLLQRMAVPHYLITFATSITCKSHWRMHLLLVVLSVPRWFELFATLITNKFSLDTLCLELFVTHIACRHHWLWMVATISLGLLLLSCPVMERVLLTLHVTWPLFNLERVIIKQNIQSMFL